MVAAVVLPYRMMLLYTCWSLRPSAFCIMSAMRRLAWWATSSVRSRVVWPVAASTAATDSGIRATAWRNTSLPSISRKCRPSSICRADMRGWYIDRGGLDLRAHHQHVAVEAHPDERVGDGERVDEPAALVPDVDRRYRTNP